MFDILVTAQKMKFSIRISSVNVTKSSGNFESLMENFIFCVVSKWKGDTNLSYVYMSCVNNAVVIHWLDLQNNCLPVTLKTSWVHCLWVLSWCTSDMSFRCLYKLLRQRFCQKLLIFANSCLLYILKTYWQDTLLSSQNNC